ncbi:MULTISPECIES: response regulator transcription factor [Mesonia]|uniref:Transcriptional activator protein CzcR n=1 Tax=Mesonia oceanica TaxID=2687242 RepID=A0AC61YBT6_9FLAO|nr:MULTISPECIES: response regulator transcription factor [Mesonia]MAN26411.1 DNA-binding response regulator [Mesonia sp.]MAQ41791.1 DNA-binding response regulator [Mesonia sp.]MBJ98301.1 DNA-binding response regulator [Flavobacteriaceae bacterium]VVV01735.1 Transcriptional activator protein CzcR [Mesonia oceanica]|tara:strand:- start:62292 stop:62960 length:669 start_codon:yes stop_codon:yes gene_type:complete
MHILIIEDEQSIVDFLQQGLEEEAYEVSSFTNGKEGLQYALQQSFDLIILDWMLPGLPGIEVCKEIRKQDSTTPIIFLTAKDTIEETIEGLQSGANDYIKKPFHFTELLERIKVQLRSKTDENFSYQLGKIQLNPSTHQVFKNEKEIKLTQKEFSLLEYLLKHKEQVCTRKKILENVWDINFDYDSGVIDVFINALRKKLHLSAEENYIQTVRGVGYIAKEE